MANSIHHTLKSHFGYTEFRHSQQAVIQAVLNKQDVLAVLPTGGGKSICYQLPTLHTGGKCLVISPLIALIKDQVLGLRNRNINALAIHSGMSPLEVEYTYKIFDAPDQHFLFISPERLKSKLFLDYLSDWPITLIAIDEAHCISQWGYDFRPQYLLIAQCKAYAPRASLLALTASATNIVATDICEKLQLKNPVLLRNSIVRNNLQLQVIQVENKINSAIEILQHTQASALIYCSNRKTTVQISEALEAQYINCRPYHAGMELNMRNKVQEDWLSEAVQVVACTQAFGMGIDKSNVRCVIHYNFTDSLEAYYQEIGRAGRDGEASKAILLFRQAELYGINEKVALRYPEPNIVFQIYDAICNYYRIGYNLGENEWFDFDLPEVCLAIQQNTMLVHNALNILQQQEYILLSDGIFISSRVLATCSKADIDFLESTNPLLAIILNTVLRLYSGIFRSHAAIQEHKIAHLAEVDLHAVKPALKALHEMGMIDYTPSKDKPQLMLTQARVRDYDYTPNLELVNFLRERYKQNLTSVHEFITNTDTCRMQLLATYFGETNTDKCLSCDICVRQQATPIDKENFNTLQLSIMEIIKTHNNISVKELYKIIDPAQHTQAQAIVTTLIQQRIISMNLIGELKIV